MNSRQARILADAYAEGMNADTSEIHVDGIDHKVYIAMPIINAEIIVQPDGSLSIVGDNMNVLVRVEPKIVHSSQTPSGIVHLVQQGGDDEPTIERLGSAQEWRE